MRPLRLKMTAFGPYKDTETIDFTKLNGHQLFVVSGATGAGETTIFDAITFALYGTASGSDRENNRLLRSDFADDETHTSVELIFTLKGKTYRVFRQLGHVKKGNKTSTGERYEFYEVLQDGTEIPAIERQIVSELNEKLESLIGLTRDQFNQIMMLPQGEFRKLLTSDTENKEKILRRIFQTERFAKLNDLVKQRRDEAEKIFRAKEDFLEHLMQSVQTMTRIREGSKLAETFAQEHFNIEQVLHGIEEEINYLHHSAQKKEKQYEVALKKFNEKQAQLNHAKELDARFKLLEEKKSEQERLTALREHFRLKEELLELAEKASRIVPYEEQVIQRQKEVESFFKKVAERERELQLTEENYHKAKETFEKEAERQTERESLEQMIKTYEEYITVLDNVEDLTKELQMKQKQVEVKTLKVQELAEDLKNEEEQLKQLNEKIAAMELMIYDRTEKQHELYELREFYKVLEQYMRVEKKRTSLKDELTETKRKWNKAKKAFAQLESLWLKNQAVVMAARLKDNEACPVCGSIHHPKKADMLAEDLTLESYDREKKRVEDIHATYQSQLATYKTYEQELKELAQEVSSYGVSLETVEEVTQEIIEKGKKLKETLEQMEKTASKLLAEKESREKIEKNVSEKRKQKEILEQDLQKLRETYTTLRATYDERVRFIPEVLRDEKILEEKVKMLTARYEDMVTAWDKAQEQLTTLEKKYTELKITLIHEKNQLEKAQAMVEQVEKIFYDELQKANFQSRAAYERVRLVETERLNIRKEIETYKEQVITVKAQINELEAELKDTSQVKIDALERETNELKQGYEVALADLNDTKQQKKNLELLQEDLKHAYCEMKTYDKKLALVRNLYDIVRGQNNSRISFERYLQIDYLEQIMYAANERFKQLTNGQFTMLRSERKEARGKQSGLAIDVYDSYTGQTRDVKSLSGGEKFIASLCLALGVSDVIQQYKGGISMETMFIDEGFGSLDEETLHKAVDVLASLEKTGRMIGVISHFEELKTMFPVRLEVTKTKAGHSTTKFVFK